MLKSLIRDLICTASWITGLTHPKRYAKEKLTVVTFHRILTSEQRALYPYPNLALTPRELDWVLTQLQKYYRCGTLTHSYNCWRETFAKNQNSNTKMQLQKPLLALTFDDGQLDNFKNALPVLKKHQLDATFYIPVEHIDEQQLIWHDRLGFAASACLKESSLHDKLLSLSKSFNIFLKSSTIGSIMSSNQINETINNIVQKAKLLAPESRRDYILAIESLSPVEVPSWANMMSWDEINTMSSAGHEIGSHTMTHALIPQLSDQELEWELTESKRQLELKLGKEIHSFCYPNGDNDPRTQIAVAKAGYCNAVTTHWGINAKHTGQHAIKRCDIDAHRLLDRNQTLSLPRLFFRLSGLQPGLR
ncbi:MAG: peptidoglycan/xylan/chitin deacetylase (PgdA/CDA1 family) [Lentisphaeria bacterium]|jgi:peptidoglycan/xylan/chitin deacetylase (PgdA/CDA1 family)